MRKSRRLQALVLGAALILLGGADSRAEQFWIAYEGDDYPENQGWERACGNELGDDDVMIAAAKIDAVRRMEEDSYA